jgi:hypothetical protein
MQMISPTTAIARSFRAKLHKTDTNTYNTNISIALRVLLSRNVCHPGWRIMPQTVTKKQLCTENKPIAKETYALP